MTAFKWTLIGWLFAEALMQWWRIEHPRPQPLSAGDRCFTALWLTALGCWALTVLP